MQRFIILGASSSTPEFRLKTFDEYFMDDNLWCQAMSTGQYLEDHQRDQSMNGDERVLWSMIRLGILDKEGIDKPWDASTRSMRHSAVIGDRLWSMVKKEQQRVFSSLPLLVTKETEKLFLGWSPREGLGRGSRDLERVEGWSRGDEDSPQDHGRLEQDLRRQVQPRARQTSRALESPWGADSRSRLEHH